MEAFQPQFDSRCLHVEIQDMLDSQVCLTCQVCSRMVVVEAASSSSSICCSGRVVEICRRESPTRLAYGDENDQPLSSFESTRKFRFDCTQDHARSALAAYVLCVLPNGLRWTAVSGLRRSLT